MGKIQLVGIEVMARIGLLEEEQYAPQDLLVSLDLTYDFESIKISDEITEGIDYRDLISTVRNFATAYDGKTLEKFAHLLATEIKEKFPELKLKFAKGVLFKNYEQDKRNNNNT